MVNFGGVLTLYIMSWKVRYSAGLIDTFQSIIGTELPLKGGICFLVPWRVNILYIYIWLYAYIHIYIYIYVYIYIYICQSLNSQYFHKIGDGHQPNSKAFFLPCNKDSQLEGGWLSPTIGSRLTLAHISTNPIYLQLFADRRRWEALGCSGQCVDQGWDLGSCKPGTFQRWDLWHPPQN